MMLTRLLWGLKIFLEASRAVNLSALVLLALFTVIIYNVVIVIRRGKLV